MRSLPSVTARPTMVDPHDLPEENETFFQPGSALAHALAQYCSNTSSPWRMTVRPWRSPAAASWPAAVARAPAERPCASGVDIFHERRPGPGEAVADEIVVQADRAAVAAAEARSERRVSI